MIRSLFASLFFCVALVAQVPVPLMSPIVASKLVNATSILNVHEDGQLSLVNMDNGTISYTMAIQELRTSWVDMQGVTHTVVTPLPDLPTLSQIESALAAHETLVQAAQKRFPPRRPTDAR